MQATTDPLSLSYTLQAFGFSVQHQDYLWPHLATPMTNFCIRQVTFVKTKLNIYCSSKNIIKTVVLIIYFERFW